MTPADTAAPAAPASATATATATPPVPNGLYHTAWRWHFYAALYVIPFLVMLATTGLFMLWTAALSDMNGEKTRVVPHGAALATSALQARAESALPGHTATQYVQPLAPDRVATFRLIAGDAATAVLIDPYTGTVQATMPWRAGWYDFANDIHGTLLIGPPGDRLIELAASLAVVLVVTGLYLHWPRGAGGWRAALLPRLHAPGRALWRSLHGVVGIWASALMLVFLVSGLSWSGIWGERLVQAWSTFPAAKWDAVPLSDATHASLNHDTGRDVPWALEQTPLPRSGSALGAPAVAAPVTLDAVVAFARSLGLDGRFQVNLPTGPQGVWTISHDTMSNDGTDPRADRTLHIDQYSGRVLADVGFADYSAYAKAMAVGIAFHEGDLGRWNLALNTLFCAAMIFLPLSGVVLWWKRRPAGARRLAAPPRAQSLPLWTAGGGLVTVLGVLFPLAGLAMLAALLLDFAVLRHLPGLRRALS